MSFNWSEYHTLAQELASRSDTNLVQEAHLRTAISRAYYSAFCQARNHLRDKENRRIPENAEAHKIVGNAFARSRKRDRQRIGLLLRNLRATRNRADYDNIFPCEEVLGKAKAALEQAKEILNLLARL